MPSYNHTSTIVAKCGILSVSHFLIVYKNYKIELPELPRAAKMNMVSLRLLY